MSVDVGDLIRRAQGAGLTLACAESCTGGLIAAALTDIPGSSAVLDRGFVTYSNRAKIQMLGVRAATLKAHGAVSEEVAEEMASGALRAAEVSLAVSVTGIAGPGDSEHKPEGRVCFGLAMQDQPTWVETIDFGALGRARVRLAARDHALMLVQQGLSLLDS